METLLRIDADRIVALRRATNLVLDLEIHRDDLLRDGADLDTLRAVSRELAAARRRLAALVESCHQRVAA